MCNWNNPIRNNTSKYDGILGAEKLVDIGDADHPVYALNPFERRCQQPGNF
jgi:hypothetical protein